MNRLFVIVLAVGLFVWGYVKGYENGVIDGQLMGERRALSDMGVSDETILSQTT